MKTWLTLAALAVSTAASAQESRMNAAELAHALDRLSTSTRVLYIAAHPDDENTRLLTHLANERHFTVAYLSMTRGGGGQNLIGLEQGELLDVIRTEELLGARSLDGAHQRFTRMRDFGYSKRASETLALWGHDEALSDVVRVIRSFQPDVIIARFDERPPNHGHHTASATLAREAFAAAADASKFAEQKLPAWKTLRLFHNLTPWREGPVPPDAVTVDVGGYDARLGLSYGELAANSRSQHKSQGFGVAGERGPLTERFALVAGTPAKAELVDAVPPGWTRYGAAGAAFAKAIDDARAALDRDSPERAIPALLKARAAADALPKDARTSEATAELERILSAAAGVFIRATAPKPTAVPGGDVEVQLEVLARRPAEVQVERAVFPGDVVVPGGGKLALNEKRVLKKQVTISKDAAMSLPYWLAEEPERGHYKSPDPVLIGAPRGPPALTIGVDLVIAGRKLRVDAPVIHSWTDRVHGERLRPFLIVPPATVTPVREAVLSVNGKPGALLLRIRAGADKTEGTVKLPAVNGWRFTPNELPVVLAKAGDEVTVRFEVKAEGSAGVAELRPSFESGGRSWSIREDVVDYPHIPLQLVLQPASVRLTPVSLAIPKGVVGYVVGSGDSLPDDLAHVGVKIALLDDSTLRSGDLGAYSAIVLGIRAYNTRPAVRAAHSRLMSYVERGGKLVVQYNTTSRWAPLEGPLGPFPFEIANERITDETAEMIAVNPADALLKTPNKISKADFDGWVQERGIYFAKSWDERYKPLFKAADPEEQPLLGGTLVASHGKGRYIYTGLAFFRQTRAGVPGAYRLLVNFIH